MRQLAGTDAYHVLEETPAQHMHTMKIVIIDASAAPQAITMGLLLACTELLIACLTGAGTLATGLFCILLQLGVSPGQCPSGSAFDKGLLRTQLYRLSEAPGCRWLLILSR